MVKSSILYCHSQGDFACQSMVMQKMKYAAIAYFVISGLIMGWQGLRMISSTAHRESPEVSIVHSIVQGELEAAVTRDPTNKKMFEEYCRMFYSQLDRVMDAIEIGGFRLCVFGALHFGLGLILLSVRQKKPNQRVELSETRNGFPKSPFGKR